MPQVGPPEIFMVVLIALIVFGPEKLPEMARSIGKAIADLRRVADEAKGEFQFGLNFDEDDQDHPMHEALNGSAERPESRYPEGAPQLEDGKEGGPPFDSDGERRASSSSTSLTQIPSSLEPAPREDPDEV